MIPLSLAEIAKAVEGRLDAPDPTATVTGPVEFDSRKIAPGGLFVAFDGESVDGHDFAGAAVRAGAVGMIGTRAVQGVPGIVVADPLTAMARLARYVVDRLPDVTVVGLTGSSGKTTTKDFVGQLLRRLGPTVAPAGSFNNELGHPHTVLQADADTRWLVLEMGARGIGHITYLAGVAPPRIGAVLNVGVAHIGEFGSQQAIATAKGELVEALPPDGTAVLNADDELVRGMASRTEAKVLLVGEAADADVRAEGVALDERGRASYRLITPYGSAPVRLGVTGAHQVANTLTAAAVALTAGLSLNDIAGALGELRLLSTRRMDVFDRADDVTVIDDSYNANPASMSAALRALVSIGAGRRRIAVLGYMAELGEHEREGHESVGAMAARLGVDRLIVVGEPAEPIHHGAQTVPGWKGISVAVADQDRAIEVLRSEVQAGDVILVKGSRYRTWDVADALRAGVGGADRGNGAAAAREATA
jgi:UDP-N-acetylmuramoyl-tripeptide--D-alanyl-D-alanine ligase